MAFECAKKFHYCGKLEVGKKGDGDSGGERPSIVSIDWSDHVFNQIVSGLKTRVLDMVAVTGSGGTYIYQRVKPLDSERINDMEDYWILVHHDPELIGNICRFAKTTRTNKTAGLLAVAVPPRPNGEGAKVYMITLKENAVLKDLETDLETGSLFDTNCFFWANLADPTYNKKIIDVCWGHDPDDDILLILREAHPEIHSVRWAYGSRNDDGSDPHHYWWHENFKFDSLNPREVDTYAAMSPVGNAFVACTKSSSIKIFRKGEQFSPGGNHHWYAAGQLWKEKDSEEEVTGYISLAFSPSSHVAKDHAPIAPLAGMKENGEINLFSLEFPGIVGNAELVMICKLKPIEELEKPIYMAWAKPTVLWTCSQQLESLTMFCTDVNSNWVSCSRKDNQNTGVAPFNSVSGLSCNQRKTNSVSWVGQKGFVLFAVNGNDCLRKVRKLVDEKFIKDPAPSPQLIEFSNLYEQTIVVLKRLLTRALSQSQDEHHRLAAVLEGLEYLLGEIYRGNASHIPLQSFIEELYEKGRNALANR